MATWRLRKREEEILAELSQNYSSSGNGAITLGAASLLILNQNPKRNFAVITNDSANTIYLSFAGTAIGSQGIRLNASGGVIIFGLATDIPYTGPVAGIAPAGASIAVFVES
jgi:hypothetical protein